MQAHLVEAAKLQALESVLARAWISHREVNNAAARPIPILSSTRLNELTIIDERHDPKYVNLALGPIGQPADRHSWKEHIVLCQSHGAQTGRKSVVQLTQDGRARPDTIEMQEEGLEC